MKKTCAAWAIVVLLIVGGLAIRIATPMVRFGYGFSESALRMLWSSEGETTWAPGFDEAKFSSIKPGMMREEVHRLLGEPVKRWDGPYPDSQWDYSWQTRGTDSYDARRVHFTQSGAVDHTEREYYID